MLRRKTRAPDESRVCHRCSSPEQQLTSSVSASCGHRLIHSMARSSSLVRALAGRRHRWARTSRDASHEGLSTNFGQWPHRVIRDIGRNTPLKASEEGWRRAVPEIRVESSCTFTDCTADWLHDCLATGNFQEGPMAAHSSAWRTSSGKREDWALTA